MRKFYDVIASEQDVCSKHRSVAYSIVESPPSHLLLRKTQHCRPHLALTNSHQLPLGLFAQHRRSVIQLFFRKLLKPLFSEFILDQSGDNPLSRN